MDPSPPPGDGSAAEALGDHVKALEADAAGRPVARDLPFVVRLDGHAFSTWTRGFAKPHDPRLSTLMVAVAEDLLAEFCDVVTAYTESDEISLVFAPPASELASVAYNGRLPKLCSLTAAFASARFNHRAAALRFEPGEEALAARAASGRAYFDARVVRCRSERDAHDAVWWRYRHDTFRNGVNGLAQAAFSREELHGRPLGEVIRMLRDRGVELDAQPPALLYGTFCKRERYERPGRDPRTGAVTVAVRHRVRSASFRLHTLQDVDARVRFCLARLWDPAHLEGQA